MSSPENYRSYSSLPHILVVDDDARIRDLVCRYLLDHGFVPIGAGTAAEARDVLAQADIDAAVVDVMMPGETGVEFTAGLRQLSAGKLDLPIILLTALGEVSDRINGLQSGADDYLVKPFEPQELVLRLQALLRRSMKPVQGHIKLRFGSYLFYGDGDGLIADDGKILALTEAESALLAALAVRLGQVVSRDILAEESGISGARAIDVQITRLRRKIEQDTRHPRYLKTVRGQGYMLRAEEVET